MPSVGIRELQRDTSGVVGRVARTGRPAFITKRGEVVAVVYPVDPAAFEDYALANAPEYVRSMEEADLALIEGRTRSSDEVFAELGGSPPSPSEAGAFLEFFSSLTEREREILARLVEGRSSAEIAGELSISRATARNHVLVILRKLQASSRVTAGRT